MNRTSSWNQRIAHLLDSHDSGHCHSLREFIGQFNATDLMPVDVPVDVCHEVVGLSRKSLINDGPALLFKNTTHDSNMPLLGNLYGAQRRVLKALNVDSLEAVRALGEQLAYFQSPELPQSWQQSGDQLKQLSRLAYVNPRTVAEPACREVILRGDEVDLNLLPVPTCWPEDAGPLITFGMVITQAVNQGRQNIGIYRQQVLNKSQVIMRWLKHRGGATDFQAWKAEGKTEKFPLVVVIGADPATTMAAVSPIPDTLSEFNFAGLLRGAKTQVTPSILHPDIMVPAHAEIVLEGHVSYEHVEPEGPFGDHTGYYNSVASFPVFTVELMSMRNKAIYHNSYMGQPNEDEPSVMASVLNEMFIPMLQKQFPEVVDFYLPPAACSYRLAVVSIKKQYPGHARRIMMGIWSFLRQFSYTKYIIVVDDDIDTRDWDAVLWAISTRSDPVRDSMLQQNTPVDYLDFASPEVNLGGKLGIDATHKWPQETKRTWGRVIKQPEALAQRVESLWNQINIQ
ncbi:UbiD family decarboxylase [Marinicella rhabdoformis]|uniref:UbiD family decarboxylase n=1 Tax=Marinicella rhabdoformis TaxID=2580566 RepID=UPI0012AEC049|nr:UbiD family decarboxylase [Marinicella rhabdoformis]